MSTEFRPADQPKTETWEHQHNKVFADVLRLFDAAITQAKENTPEGGTFTAEASIQGFSIKVATNPPQCPQASVSGKERTKETEQPPPKFDRQGIDDVVMANPTLLNLTDEGGRITISPKKFLGDLWSGINEDLKKHGMKWISQGKQSRWEGQP